MSDSPFALPAARPNPRWRAALCVGPVVALAHLFIATIRSEPQAKPLEYVTIGLVFGTFFGQVTLAAAFTALGPFPLIWRLPLSLAWLAASVVVLTINFWISGPRGDFAIVVVFGCVAFGQWLLAQAPLWGLAVGYGLRVRHTSETSSGLDRKDRQFGIRELLIVTAVVAVVLGIGRALAILIAPHVTLEYEPFLIVSFLAVAGIIMTLPLVLAAMLPRHAVLSSLMVLVLIGLGTLAELPLLSALHATPGGGGPEVWHFYCINGFQCLSVVAVIGALRLAGYGLNDVIK